MKACISVSPKAGDRSNARARSWLQQADAEKKNTPSPKGRKNACECQSSALDFARGKPSVPIVQHGLRQADDKAGRYPRAWRRSFQRQVGLSMPPGARRWFWTSWRPHGYLRAGKLCSVGTFHGVLLSECSPAVGTNAAIAMKRASARSPGSSE